MLGEDKEETQMHLITEWDLESQALFAYNRYNPAFGARPLKRAIQKEVETPLARKLVAGEIRDGQKVRVDVARLAGSEPGL